MLLDLIMILYVKEVKTCPFLGLLWLMLSCFCFCVDLCFLSSFCFLWDHHLWSWLNVLRLTFVGAWRGIVRICWWDCIKMKFWGIVPIRFGVERAILWNCIYFMLYTLVLSWIKGKIQDSSNFLTILLEYRLVYVSDWCWEICISGFYLISSRYFLLLNDPANVL